MIGSALPSPGGNLLVSKRRIQAPSEYRVDLMEPVRLGLSRDVVLISQFERESDKRDRFQRMQENLDSCFRQDLAKFQEEIKRRQERMKKYDEILTTKSESHGFRFLKYHKKRQVTRDAREHRGAKDEEDRNKGYKQMQERIKEAEKRR